MTPTERQELRELEATAAPGPWARPRRRPASDSFIVAARNALPELLNDIDRLEAEVERLREYVRLRDPRNASELYDVIAEAFYRETGYLACGKSIALEMTYTDEQEAIRVSKWRQYLPMWHEEQARAALEGK